jgi:hypothetical protein
MPIISIYGKKYNAEEYFVLKPSDIRKWGFSYFFKTLRSIDHCDDENVDVFFYRVFGNTNMLVVCKHFEGGHLYEVMNLVTAVYVLENNLNKYNKYATALIDLLDGVAEKLIISIISLPRAIYNYYRKRHKDRIITQ